MREDAAASTVEAVYKRVAPVYDLLYGVGLEHGRRRAMVRLAPRAGERILEVGVGTALSALDYPSSCRVVAIDLSGQMLARARARLTRCAVRHVVLCRMDAACLAFPDARFDAIYAPYVINVVPDPLRVAREMLRVCRPRGRLVLLNHFDSANRRTGVGTRILGGLAARTSGVNWHLELGRFLHDAALTPVSIDQVNFGISTVVVCRKP